VKKLFSFLGLISPLLAASPVFAADVTVCPKDVKFAPLCNLQLGNFSGIVSGILTILLIIAIIIAVFFLIYGGIRWITSGGDKQAVESARNHIVAAIIGLIIALLAFFIINIVLGLLGLGSLSTFTLPTLVTPVAP